MPALGKRGAATLCAVFALITLFNLTLGLVSEQDWFKNSWKREFVGEPKFVEVIGNDGSMLVVGTESNVVAGLSKATGSIEWRYPLPEGENLVEMKRYNGFIVTLSETTGRAFVRFWDAIGGRLMWERDITLSKVDTKVTSVLDQQNGATNIVFMKDDVDHDGIPEIAVLAETVSILKSSTGAPLFTGNNSSIFKNTVEISRILGIAAAPDNGLLLTSVTFSKDSQIKSVASSRLKFQDGKIQTIAVGEAQLPFAQDAHPVWIGSGSLAFFKNEKTLTICEPTKDYQSVSCYESNDVQKLLRDEKAIKLSFNLQAAAKGLLVLMTPTNNYYLTRKIVPAGQDGAKLQLDVAFTVPAGSTSKAVTACSRINSPDASNQALSPIDFLTFAEVYTSGKTNSLAIVQDPESTKVLAPERPFTGRGHVKRCFSSALPDGTYEHFVVADDESFSYITPRVSGAVWVTEQSLARVATVNFVDLPGAFESAADSSTETIAFPSIAGRAAMLADSVVSFVSETVDSVSKLLGQKGTEDSAHVGPKYLALDKGGVTTSLSNAKVDVPAGGHVRDPFGYNQLVLMTTASGKVFAFLSLTGELIWSSHLMSRVADAEDGASGSSANTWKLTNRKVHVVSRMRSKTVVALITYTIGDQGRTAVVGFNPLTGSPRNINFAYRDTISPADSDVAILPYKVTSVIALPWTAPNRNMPLSDPEHQAPSQDKGRILLVALENGHAAVIPGTELAVSTVQAKANVTYFTAVHKSTKGKSTHDSLVGNTFTPDLKVVEVWRRRFAEDENVAAISGPQTSPIYSAIRVVGDFKDSLTRYIRPNLIVVATTFVSKRAKDRGVALFVIDSVTGEVVHRAIQPRGTGPVHLAFVENTVVAHYRSRLHGNPEVTVMDLYDKLSVTRLESRLAVEAGNKDAALLPNTVQELSQSPLTSNSNPLVSSYDFQLHREASLPAVLQQSFAFKGGVQGIGFSRTRLGVTPPEFYFLLDDGHVATIPRGWLDARRPQGKPSQDDSEEGLVPYLPFIEPIPAHYLSANRTIARAQNIISAPTGLESTSLIAVTGLDIFVSRSQPAGRFDVLNEDFAFGFLIATVTFVIGGAWFAYHSAQSAALKRDWK